jgi:hypothetical protein
MPVVRHGGNKTKDMNSSFRVEPIQKDRIRRLDISPQLEFRVINDDVTLAPDS